MSVSRISARYAKSLLELAIERGELETIKDDVLYFSEAVKNRDLYLLLKSPIINADKKLAVLHAIFANKLAKTTMSFFDIIVKKGREEYLTDIASSFNEQYKIYNKITTVSVTTATALKNEALEEIKSRLKSSGKVMDNIDIVAKVDPSIIGGFVLEIEDKKYDASVQHKLELIKKEFMGNNYIKTF